MISTAAWKRAVSPALDDRCSWAHRGKLTYCAEPGWVLLGVHGEGSGFQRDRLYISAVVMPLFVPSQHLTLNFSKRVPDGASTFALDDAAAFREAVTSALSHVPSEVEALHMISRSTTDEAGAYATLLLGNVAEAEQRLAEPFHPSDARDFVERERARRQVVLDALQTSGPTHAIDVLRSWRDSTATALRIA